MYPRSAERLPQFSEGRTQLLEAVAPERLQELVDNEDVSGAISTMKEVLGILPDAGLAQLTEFSRVYLLLTEKVHERITTSDPNLQFQHGDVVKHTVPIFARLYLKQLYAYCSDDPEIMVDPAWEPLFFDEKVKGAEPGVRFLCGMFAHIEADLAHALCESGVNDEYYDDYTRVIGILIDEVAKSEALGYVKGPKIVRSILVRYVTRQIERMRDIAWYNGKRLMQAQANKDVPQQIAIKKELDRKSRQSTRRIRSIGNAALGFWNRLLSDSSTG